MSQQMTIFDILYPDKINPIRAVAKRARPYWITSKEKLVEYYQKGISMDTFSKAVRHEYNSYGGAGAYGIATEKVNQLDGYDLRWDTIKSYYYDEEGRRKERWYTWKDFAEEIASMIISGEYDGRPTE